MSKQAAEHHRKAAEHHEHAAKHHHEAAKHHDAQATTRQLLITRTRRTATICTRYIMRVRPLKHTSSTTDQNSFARLRCHDVTGSPVAGSIDAIAIAHPQGFPIAGESEIVWLCRAAGRSPTKSLDRTRRDGYGLRLGICRGEEDTRCSRQPHRDESSYEWTDHETLHRRQ
jgi:hypothetical protein